MQNNYKSKIQTLYEHGKFSELNLLIRNIQKNTEIGAQYKNKIEIIQSKIFISVGEYKKAIKILKPLTTKNHFSEDLEDYLSAALTRCEAIYFLGKFGELRKEIDYLENFIPQLNKENFNSTKVLANLLQLKGRYYNSQGRFTEASEHLFKAESLYQKLNLFFNVAKTQNLIAGTLWQRRDVREASNYLQLAINNFMKLGNKKMLGKTLNNFGILKSETGDYDLAIQNFKLAKGISIEVGDKQNIAKTLNNLGTAYIAIGLLKKAKKTYKESLKINNKIRNKYEIAGILSNLGDIDGATGKYSRAVQNYKKSIDSFKEIGAKSSTFNPLVGLIMTYVDMHKNSEVDTFLKELKDLSESQSAYKIKYNYKIAKAYSLKNNQDNKKSQNSKLMFKELANDEKIKFNKRAFCIINYCEISLRTLDQQNFKEGIQEIKKLIKNLVSLAQKSFAFLFLAQSYLILAHIALIEGSIDEAQKNIIKSELISKEKNFPLNKKVEALKVQINKLASIPKVSDAVLTNLKKELDSMILTRS